MNITHEEDAILRQYFFEKCIDMYTNKDDFDSRYEVWLETLTEEEIQTICETIA